MVRFHPRILFAGGNFLEEKIITKPTKQAKHNEMDGGSMPTGCFPAASGCEAAHSKEKFCRF